MAEPRVVRFEGTVNAAGELVRIETSGVVEHADGDIVDAVRVSTEVILEEEAAGVQSAGANLVAFLLQRLKDERAAQRGA